MQYLNTLGAIPSCAFFRNTQLGRIWKGGDMRRIILIMCIFIFSSSAVQAEWIQVNFKFGDLSYFDYVTNQPIGKPSVLYGAGEGGFFSIEIKDPVYIYDHGHITTSIFPYLYMPTPAITTISTDSIEDPGSMARSYVYDYYNSFELNFEAESSSVGTLYYENSEDYFTAHTIVFNHIYSPPKNGDGTSDYPLYGDMLDEYFKRVMTRRADSESARIKSWQGLTSTQIVQKFQRPNSGNS